MTQVDVGSLVVLPPASDDDASPVTIVSPETVSATMVAMTTDVCSTLQQETAAASTDVDDDEEEEKKEGDDGAVADGVSSPPPLPLLSFLDILETYKVRLPANHSNIKELESITLNDLDRLLAALQQQVDLATSATTATLQTTKTTTSPGFYTQQDQGRGWDPAKNADSMARASGANDDDDDDDATQMTYTASPCSSYRLPYDTHSLGNGDDDKEDAIRWLPSYSPFVLASPPSKNHNTNKKMSRKNLLPVPSLSNALTVYQVIRALIVERMQSLCLQQQQSQQQQQPQLDDGQSSCTCIHYWDHPNSIVMLAHQALEQMMTEESSECLKKRFACGQEEKTKSVTTTTAMTLSDWNESYYATPSSVACSTTTASDTDPSNHQAVLLQETPAGSKVAVEEESLKSTAREKKRTTTTTTPSKTSSSPPFSLTYYSKIPVTLLTDRDKYMAAFVRAALAARTSIQIMTCYLFHDDPAQTYILFDLLPHIVTRSRLRNNSCGRHGDTDAGGGGGVKVQILIDLLPMEANLLKSVFRETTPQPFGRCSAVPHSITSTSFWKDVPADAPSPAADSTHQRSFSSAAHFAQQLLLLAQTIQQSQTEQQQQQQHPDGTPQNSTSSSMEVQFWCARDTQEQYRIKNHAKCAIFDGTAVIMGGSNLTPTVKSATSDLDVFFATSDVDGSGGRRASQNAVASVQRTFETLWGAMKKNNNNNNSSITTATTIRDSLAPGGELPDGVGNETDRIPSETSHTAGGSALFDLARELADDPNSEVATIQSTPSSAGEDLIFRIVLEKIRSAQSEVIIGMGHSCYPKSFAHACADATSQLRGVTVKILVNSLYSNDLRTGQQDLFRSLAYLLDVAPAVQVYATVKKKKQVVSKTDDEDGGGTVCNPEFLHGKYVVIDGEWIAVGSWNLWTRSAFHEIEHEAFIQSKRIAQLLTQKFEQDTTAHAVRVTTAEDCLSQFFCPKGCSLCKGFGPFFS